MAGIIYVCTHVETLCAGEIKDRQAYSEEIDGVIAIGRDYILDAGFTPVLDGNGDDWNGGRFCREGFNAGKVATLDHDPNEKVREIVATANALMTAELKLIGRFEVGDDLAMAASLRRMHERMQG